MGIIEEKRKLIMGEMEAGRGGDRIFSHPVSLEPPFRPYLARQLGSLRDPLFKRLFGETQKVSTVDNNISNIGELRFIRIKPSREDENSLESAEQFVLSLPPESPLSFEVIGHSGKISFQMALNSFLVDPVISQVRSHFPNMEAVIEKDLIKSAWSPQAVGRAYRLKSTHFLPLGLVSEKSLDPLRSILGSLSSLGPKELGVLQVLFVPVKEDWQDNMRRTSRSRYDPSLSPFVDLPQLPKSVDKKIARPLYAVSIRLLASSGSILEGLDRFFKQFENQDNGIEPISGSYPVDSILSRKTFVYGSILNLTELSYFVHLPAPDLLLSMPAIEEAVKTCPAPIELTSDGPVLGINEHRGVRSIVRHSRSLPNQHVYACGKSGYGKSNLILSTVLQRIEQGQGVGVLDPHGRLITEGILPRIPKERIKDTVYFDAGDFSFPMAINPLAHTGKKLEKEHIRVDMLDFFEGLFDTALGVTIQHTLNFALVTLLEFKDSTLTDIERLLVDDDWRNHLLENIHDERIRIFWNSEFPQLAKRGVITSVMNKLSPLVLPSSTIAPMLAGRENKIDFLDIMNSKKIFLGNLSIGAVGKRNSQLLGKLLLSRIQISAMMREGDCPDFYLYVDEFQNLTAPSMSDILSGARKYGLHLWLANQAMDDIPAAIFRHVYNASTMIFFASDSPSDQLTIGKTLSKKFKAEDLGRLMKGETLVKMAASTFNMKTERVPGITTDDHSSEIIAASRANYAVVSDPNPSDRNQKLPSRSQKPHAQSEQIPKPIRPISTEERSFLEQVSKYPGLSVTKVYKETGLSAYMGDKLKTSLKEKHLVKETTTHLGQGSRIAKFLLLTPDGFKALNADFDEGKGGTLHRYWQTAIKIQATSMGYTVSIEQPIPDSRETVDLVLVRDGKEIAVEVSSTTKAVQEIGNVKKCLTAGYENIVTLFMDEEKLQVFEGLLLNNLNEQERSRVSAGVINGFCQFLK